MLSKNLDQGFPGDLNSECTFEIKNKSLFIKYQYKSNQLTHVSLTNHSYWNLEKIGYMTYIHILRHYRDWVGGVENGNFCWHLV